MEAGFRKIFRRRRSKSRTPHSNEFIRPPFQQSANDGVVEFRRAAEVVSAQRPNTAPGLKPVLLGTSRPSISGEYKTFRLSFGRRGSSKSSAGPLDLPQLPSSINDVRSPRSLDVTNVFRPALPSQSDGSQYNEPIAARNVGVALVTDDYVRHAYIPSSKFQEEVAIRNAASPDIQRPSFDTTRASMDGRPQLSRRVSSDRISLSSAEIYNPNSSRSRGRSLPRTISQSSLARQRDSSLSRRQQSGVRSPHSTSLEQGKSGFASPAIAQEMLGERTSRPAPLVFHSAVDPFAMYTRSDSLPAHRGAGDVSAAAWSRKRETAAHASRPLVWPLPPDRSPSIDFKAPLANANSVADSTLLASGVQAHNSDGFPWAPSPSSDQSPTTTNEARMKKGKSRNNSYTSFPLTGSSNGEPTSPLSTSSRRSVVKRKRMVPGRTFIDLTGNDSDVFTDDSEHEDADNDFERVVTELVDPAKVLRASVVSAHDYTYQGSTAESLSHDGLVIRPHGLFSSKYDTLWEESASQTGSDRRSSGYIQLPPPFVPTHDLSGTTLGASKSIVKALSQSAGSPVSVPDDPTADHIAGFNHSTESAAPEQIISVNPSPAKTPFKLSEAILYTTPESLKSNGAIIPQPSGVSFRDFAVSPNTANHSARVAPIQLRPALKKPSSDRASPPNRQQAGNAGSAPRKIPNPLIRLHSAQPTYDTSSTVDEVLASKKAAIEEVMSRLKKSLDETFIFSADTLTPSTPKKQRPDYLRDLSFEEGGPISPSSMFKRPKPGESVAQSTNEERPSTPSSTATIVAVAVSTDEAPLRPRRDFSRPACPNRLSSGSGEASYSLQEDVRPDLLPRREASNGQAKRAQSVPARPYERSYSIGSVASSRSAHSVPFHMVPRRRSSLLKTSSARPSLDIARQGLDRARPKMNLDSNRPSIDYVMRSGSKYGE